MSGRDQSDDMDMQVIQHCLKNLKLSKTFEQAMELASIMMNLKKTSANDNPEFLALVTDVATRAIETAEKLRAAKPREKTDEEKEAERAAISKAWRSKNGALGGGLTKKPGPDMLVRVSSAERRARLASGASGGGSSPMSAYAGKASRKGVAADPRRDYYGSLTAQATMAKAISAQCREKAQRYPTACSVAWAVQMSHRPCEGI
jgi:hypothetical protein